MTRVTGDLKIITGMAEAVTEVWVRSKVSRPVPGGWLMTTNDRKPVFDGKVDLELLPGACVLVAVSSGLPGESVELIVPESGTASLEACIRAAESAGDLERDALDELRRDVGAWLDEARASVSAAGESAAAAAGSASAAKADADKATASATTASDAAARASASESAAATSADSAAKSASAAKTSETNAGKSATTASTHATNAGKSATTAKTEADRAANIASSTSWDGDKLTVNGKTSPPLKGEKGDKGEPGESGASTWDTVTGKPSAFPPEPHKHAVADITDLPESTPHLRNGAIVQRDSSGRASVNAPLNSLEIANKGYVDTTIKSVVGSAVQGKADKSYVDSKDAEARALAESRPAFFSGAGSPPSTIPGAVVGDYYLDETTMELHKITGV